MPFGFSSRHALGRQVVADDLAEDVLLAHAPGDELAVLRAEVEDQDEFVGHVRNLYPQISQMTQIGNQRTEVRGQKPEIRMPAVLVSDLCLLL